MYITIRLARVALIFFVCFLFLCQVSSAFIVRIPLRLVLGSFPLPIWFSQHVSLSVQFLGIVCSYINFIQYIRSAYFGPFLYGMLLFQSLLAARHFGLVFHLYFSFILSGPCFSLSILVGICCSLLLFKSHSLLIIYSLMQLVMVQKIFLFIFFFVRLCSRNITCQFSVQFI